MSVTPSSDLDKAALLRCAATLERGSEHPLAAAIIKGAQERGIVLGYAERFASITGKGVTGKMDGRMVALGNHALLQELNIDPGTLDQAAEQQRAEGQTVMFVAVDGQVAGLLGIADPIKPARPSRNWRMKRVRV